MISVRHGREASKEYKHCFPPYRPGLYTLSHLFVQHVFCVGHSEKAELRSTYLETRLLRLAVPPLLGYPVIFTELTHECINVHL
jgi:hypothetical protein